MEKVSVAQLDRASASGAEGCAFKSRRRRKLMVQLTKKDKIVMQRIDRKLDLLLDLLAKMSNMLKSPSTNLKDRYIKKD